MHDHRNHFHGSCQTQSHAKPSQAKPSQAKPSQAKPSHTHTPKSWKCDAVNSHIWVHAKHSKCFPDRGHLRTGCCRYQRLICGGCVQAAPGVGVGVPAAHFVFGEGRGDFEFESRAHATVRQDTHSHAYRLITTPQVILGIGYEIQSDSIGSGNNGLPAANTSVPNDLVPTERTRFFKDMLQGFRFCRLAMGLCVLRSLTHEWCWSWSSVFRCGVLMLAPACACVTPHPKHILTCIHTPSLTLAYLHTFPIVLMAGTSGA
jgi:hypothetical protein